MLLLDHLPLAADPLPAWTGPLSGSLLGLGIIFIVYASIKGIITWPPEKKRMQDTIDLVVGELKKSNENASRALPTTARLVEVVEQRVSKPDSPFRIDQRDLIAALRVVASEGRKVVGDDAVGDDR